MTDKEMAKELDNMCYATLLNWKKSKPKVYRAVRYGVLYQKSLEIVKSIEYQKDLEKISKEIDNGEM